MQTPNEYDPIELSLHPEQNKNKTQKTCILKHNNDKQNHTHTPPNNLVDLWFQKNHKATKNKNNKKLVKTKI